jgi:exopolyphosphatase/guanosine-5'-triphosphate,3'-diphosphate pyrophosphatase
LAAGFIAMDPDPNWKQMKKAGKRVFSSLGELRDVQVMEGWVKQLGAIDDPVTDTLLRYLAERETKLKTDAALALQQFDVKQWMRWSRLLSRRARRLRKGSPVFRHLALEHWQAAYDLHRHALRSRSQVSWHQLRIGIKRFRYIVENFLPRQHAAWKDDLKFLQDVLGEVHDLDVLWATALSISAFPDVDARARWRKRIVDERESRIKKYRDKMVGKQSLWPVWRAELPQGPQIASAARQRLEFWASSLDPDFAHARAVSHLALQLYDGLVKASPTRSDEHARSRDILQIAALLHDVGRSKATKGHHKTSFKLIRRLSPPLGWSGTDLAMAATIARYHRGALPRTTQKALHNLTAAERRAAMPLAGVLRLADAFDVFHGGTIQKLEVLPHNGYFVVRAEGYSPRSRNAERIARARHLLEIVYRRPILVRSLGARTASRPRAASGQ